MSLTLYLFCLLGLLLDAVVGEPRRWHPLVGFGKLADALARRVNRNPSGRWAVAAGGLAVVLLTVPVLAMLVVVFALLPAWGDGMVSVIGLWLVVGRRSLVEHALAVQVPLQAGESALAREQVGRIVSRDCSALDEVGIARAATESVLENGADALFASLFWFVAAGLPGALLHRLVNTLDAMWGYRNARFERFGKVAARLDDVMGWLPARLTAWGYALCGHLPRARRCWRRQAPACDSPNAGPVMAAGAGALGVLLGGPAHYHGEYKDKPVLGEGRPATAESIGAAIRLLHRTLLLWLGAMACLVWLT